MHEALWNGLFDVRWEEAPLGGGGGGGGGTPFGWR